MNLLLEYGTAKLIDCVPFLSLFHQRHAGSCTDPFLDSTFWCSCKHDMAPRAFYACDSRAHTGLNTHCFLCLLKKSSSSAQVMFHAQSSLLHFPTLPLPYRVLSLLSPSHGSSHCDPHLGRQSGRLAEQSPLTVQLFLNFYLSIFRHTYSYTYKSTHIYIYIFLQYKECSSFFPCHQAFRFNPNAFPPAFRRTKP